MRRLKHDRSLVRRQIRRMASQWPDFRLVPMVDDLLTWVGPLRGFQRSYTIAIIWNSATDELPEVRLLDPPLKPREGGTFEEIPHLRFYSPEPVNSGLCLFDPDGHEWSPRRMIAETTLPWAAEWLYYYEFWLFDGIWRGSGVGPESVAKMRS